MKSCIAVMLLLLGSLAFGQSRTNVSAQTKTPRVYLDATYGHVYLRGVDHAVPRLDAYGHNQTMELAKTFLQRCPEALLTTNEDRADFKVSLNWADQTRLFMLGKLLHKPDQIMVTNRDGDVIFSGVARSLGGDTQDACRVIMSAVVPVQHGEPLTGRMNYWTPTAPAPATPATADPVKMADTAAPGPASYQCSEYTLDRLGMKNCTKWILK
ncbi:MAG TPA: hypothetical protein VIH75_13675 [Candidatus Sulfotelmatobacter sp.]|jgi:hypothetical protein